MSSYFKHNPKFFDVLSGGEVPFPFLNLGRFWLLQPKEYSRNDPRLGYKTQFSFCLFHWNTCLVSQCAIWETHLLCTVRKQPHGEVPQSAARRQVHCPRPTSGPLWTHCPLSSSRPCRRPCGAVVSQPCPALTKFPRELMSIKETLFNLPSSSVKTSSAEISRTLHRR